MLLVAAALYRDQGSGSAVRLGNDNIEHARPPLGRVALRRAFPRARFAVGATATRIDLPRAWCARSVSSFSVALFCKTSGNTRTVQSQKKKTSRGRASRYVSREKWPSLLNARRAAAERRRGKRNGAPPLSVDAAASRASIRRERPT